MIILTPERYLTRVGFRGNGQHNFTIVNVKNNDVTFEEFIFIIIRLLIYIFIYLLHDLT